MLLMPAAAALFRCRHTLPLLLLRRHDADAAAFRYAAFRWRQLLVTAWLPCQFDDAAAIDFCYDARHFR